jgi:hypothetical protein
MRKNMLVWMMKCFKEMGIHKSWVQTSRIWHIHLCHKMWTWCQHRACTFSIMMSNLDFSAYMLLQSFTINTNCIKINKITNFDWKFNNLSWHCFKVHLAELSWQWKLWQEICRRSTNTKLKEEWIQICLRLISSKGSCVPPDHLREMPPFL